MKDEIFGPILILIQIKKYQDAIQYINSQPKPLALYIFSEERAIIDDIVHSTSSGGVCVNQCL